jgi:epoxyqueuosine reductase QueG
MLRETPVGIASTWSERHAAYAAGLGTFSINDGLITPRGIAHRVGSVVTDLVLPPSPRPYTDHRENCLLFRGQECGACIQRCPGDALSEQGHDKDRCFEYAYGTILEEVKQYGVDFAGCGLCQTAVPCESRIPVGKKEA